MSQIISLIGQCLQVGDTLMEVMAYDGADDEYIIIPAFRNNNGIYASNRIDRAEAWKQFYAQQ